MVKDVSWKSQQANIPAALAERPQETADGAVPNRVWKSRMFEFLKKNRAEAKRMSMFEYNEERHLCLEKEYSREEGFAAGKECINELNQRLLAEGRTDELARTIRDPEYQTVLMKEYGLLSDEL